MDIFGAQVPSTAAFFLFGELAVLATLVISFVLARMHRGSAHHYLMLAAFITDLVIFKPLMFSRAASAWGAFPWDGTRIAPHMILSAFVAVLGVAVVVVGFMYRIRKGPKMFLPAKGRLHRYLGWAFLLLWTAAFASGIVIFAETYIP